MFPESISLIYLFMVSHSTFVGSSDEDPVFVENGGDAHFNWILHPEPEQNEPVTIINENGYNLFYFTQNTQPFYFIDRVEAKRNATDANIKRVQFTLKRTTAEDAGHYFSSYAAGKFVGQELILLGKPHVPVIQETNKPIEGTTLVLKCTANSTSISRHKMLNMFFEWSLDESLLKSKDKYVISGSNISIFNLQRSDSGTNIACKAYERKNMKSNISHPYILDVHYGPNELRLIPNISSYRVPRGRNELQLICNAICNPVCTYIWLKGTEVQKEGKSLVFNNFQSSDDGLYRCKVYNYIEEDFSTRVRIHVSDVPGKPFITEINSPIEGLAFKLGCFENSSKNAYTFYRLLSYNWNFDNKNGKLAKHYQQNRHVLTLSKLTKEDNGTSITCSVNSEHGHSSAYSDPYLLNIYYGPKSVHLISDKRSYKVTEGEYISSFLCWSDCSPKCRFQWYKDGNEIAIGTELSIGKATKETAGNYFCRTFNKYGSKDSINVIIEMTVLKMNESFICINNESVSLECRINSDTQTFEVLPWFHKVSKNDTKEINGESNVNVNILLINDCNALHIGSYTCRVKIPGNPPVVFSDETYLKVHGPPLFARKNAKIKLDTSNASIILEFVSMPYYQNCLWYKQGQLLHQGAKYTVTTFEKEVAIESDGDDVIFITGYQSSLSIVNISEDDFGVYRVVVNNSFGETEQEIHLQARVNKRRTKVHFVLLMIGSVTAIIAVILSVGIGLLRLYRRRKRAKQTSYILNKFRLRNQNRNMNLQRSDEVFQEIIENNIYDSVDDSTVNSESEDYGMPDYENESSNHNSEEDIEGNFEGLSENGSYEDLERVNTPVQYDIPHADNFRNDQLSDHSANIESDIEDDEDAYSSNDDHS